MEKMHLLVIFKKNFTTKKVKLLFEKKIDEKEIVFKSSVLAWIRIRNRIKIEQNAGSGSVLSQSGSTTLLYITGHNLYKASPNQYKLVPTCTKLFPDQT
jgi:hypothetical protein